MPEISRFFGISPTRIEGELPARADRLIQAWAEIHRAELARNWTALLAGRIPGRIAPLR